MSEENDKVDESEQEPKQEPEQEPEREPEPDEEELKSPDLGDRVLCPDGACIGVIGSDGRCKECGTSLHPGEDKPSTKTEDSAADDESEDDGDSDDDEEEPSEQSTDEEPEDDSESETDAPNDNDDNDLDLASRELCPDGECIGVIGPKGRCKECGKSADWKPSDDPPLDTDGDDPPSDTDGDDG